MYGARLIIATRTQAIDVVYDFSEVQSHKTECTNMHGYEYRLLLWKNIKANYLIHKLVETFNVVGRLEREVGNDHSTYSCSIDLRFIINLGYRLLHVTRHGP